MSKLRAEVSTSTAPPTQIAEPGSVRARIRALEAYIAIVDRCNPQCAHCFDQTLQARARIAFLEQLA